STSSRCVGATLSFRIHHDFFPPRSSKFKISTSRLTGDVQVQFAGRQANVRPARHRGYRPCLASGAPPILRRT
ncbi:uncharacterized protein CLUP02_03599, partial [Colletotrichum lupini]